MDISKSYYIGNLNFDATAEELKSFFEFNGFEVTRVKICYDRETKKPRGFAFVDIKDGSALDLDGQEFAGRDIRVREADPPMNRGKRVVVEKKSDRDLL